MRGTLDLGQTDELRGEKIGGRFNWRPFHFECHCWPLATYCVGQASGRFEREADIKARDPVLGTEDGTT